MQEVFVHFHLMLAAIFESRVGASIERWLVLWENYNISCKNLHINKGNNYGCAVEVVIVLL